MTSDFNHFNGIDFDFLTMGNPPSSPLYVHMVIFPIADIPECPIDVSVSDKGNDQSSLPPVPYVPSGGSVVAASVTNVMTGPLCPRPPSLRLVNRSEKQGTAYPRPLPPVRQLPIGGSVAAASVKRVTTRPPISTPIAKKKRKGKRLSRNKQDDIRKRREANARRQLQSESVVRVPTVWYPMDGANSSGMSAVVKDDI